MYQERRRVVVTGIGAVTCLGLDVPELWGNLLAGKSGISPNEKFDPGYYGLAKTPLGQVKDFDAVVRTGLTQREVSRYDPITLHALSAAKEAVEQSGLDLDEGDGSEIGVYIGIGVGAMNTMEEQERITKTINPVQRRNRVSVHGLPGYMPNAPAAGISIRYGYRGPAYTMSTACASGTDAIGMSLDLIRSGRTQVMIAGGTEAVLIPVGIAGYQQLRALSTIDYPEQASRPFDARRDGFVPSEGAAVLILESEEFALQRGAVPLAEIAGYGASSDAFHLTAPHPEGQGAVEAVQEAMRDADIKTSDIVYINAHGTSTTLNDRIETLALKRALGEGISNILVGSTKSMLGHAQGATGAIEAVVCVQALETGWLPPNRNLEFPDPECDLNFVGGQMHQLEKKDAVLSTSFAFGGHNACLVFRPYES